MNARGQMIIIVAVIIMVMTLMLAVMVDGGRVYLEKSKAERAVQAGADGGIGIVSEAIVTLAAAQQATANAAPCGVCTPTPDPQKADQWLSDDDRATLISPPVQTQVAIAAVNYASQNGVGTSDPSIHSFRIDFPHTYHPDRATLQIRVSAVKQTSLLLVGLLNREWVNLPVQGISEVRQR